MLQATAQWSSISTGEAVDSEDESWLNQPKFKLTDDSDSDDSNDIVKAAYLRAVAAITRVIDVAVFGTGSFSCMASQFCNLS